VRREIVGEVEELDVVVARDDQEVALDDRVDVQEDDRAVGLQDAGRGDLPGDDLAEEAVRVTTHGGASRRVEKKRLGG
jgi:hypothetical protein